MSKSHLTCLEAVSGPFVLPWSAPCSCAPRPRLSSRREVAPPEPGAGGAETRCSSYSCRSSSSRSSPDWIPNLSVQSSAHFHQKAL